MKTIAAAAALIALATPAITPAQSWAPHASSWDRADDRSEYFQQARYRGRSHAVRRDYGRQRCYDRGNGGLAIGGVVGALAGRAIAGRGDRTLGTLLGAGAGALAGRAIDRSDGAPCYR